MVFDKIIIICFVFVPMFIGGIVLLIFGYSIIRITKLEQEDREKRLKELNFRNSLNKKVSKKN